MSSKEWKTYKLGQIADVQTGPFGSQLHQKDYVQIGTPIITVEHLGENSLIHENLPMVSDMDKNRLQKYILKEGDIVFSRVGSVDRRALVKKAEEGWLFSGRCLRVRPISQEINANYLAYYFGFETFKTYIRAIAVGSTMPSLNTTILSEIEIPCPPISTQRRIAEILSALDDKIELNRQTNATLEAIAQAIFKEWFVNFNFPGATGEMVESELGMIPKGWRVGKLGNEGNFKNGINYSRDEEGDTEFSIVNVRNVVESKFIEKPFLSSININRKKAFPYILEPDDILIVRSASPGKTAIFLQPERKIIYSGFIIRYRIINKNYFYYMFFILQSMKDQLDNLSNGTTLKNINQEMLKPHKVTLPEEKIVLDFNLVIKPIFDILQNIIQETATLVSIRNALLPKLMSGEIEV